MQCDERLIAVANFLCISMKYQSNDEVDFTLWVYKTQQVIWILVVDVFNTGFLKTTVLFLIAAFYVDGL